MSIVIGGKGKESKYATYSMVERLWRRKVRVTVDGPKAVFTAITIRRRGGVNVRVA